MPLEEFWCSLQKTNLLLLLTLLLDKSLILETSDIFKKYLEKLSLENFVIQEKRIIFKGRNITSVIY